MTNFSIQEEWLNHIQIILIGGSWIAEKIAHESASVLVHCRSFLTIYISHYLQYLLTESIHVNGEHE